METVDIIQHSYKNAYTIMADRILWQIKYDRLFNDSPDKIIDKIESICNEYMEEKEL